MSVIVNPTEQLVSGSSSSLSYSANSAIPTISCERLQEVLPRRNNQRACSNSRFSHKRCNNKGTSLKSTEAFQAQINSQNAKPFQQTKPQMPETCFIRAKHKSRLKSAIASSKKLQKLFFKKSNPPACSYCRISHKRCKNKGTGLSCREIFRAEIDLRNAKPIQKTKQQIPGTGFIRAKHVSRSKSHLAKSLILPQTIFGPLLIGDLLN